MAAAKAEAAHNRRHYRAAMLELTEIKKDLQAKEDLVKVLQSEAHKLRYTNLFDETIQSLFKDNFILKKCMHTSRDRQKIDRSIGDDVAPNGVQQRKLLHSLHLHQVYWGYNVSI